jgi:hypothetical protein
MFAILQIITLEGWTNMMYGFYDSWNPLFTSLYFSFVVMLGSYFLLNMLLAAIWTNFTKVSEDEKEADEM